MHTSKKKELKLYVWDGALREYTSGIMFALAESPEHAKKLILKEYRYVPKREFEKEPQVYDAPIAFIVWGGGY